VEATRRAAGDAALGRNVLRATDTSLAHRAEVVAERPDWERLRERAAAVKDHVLQTLPEQLDRFREAAKARGVVVHEAKDAAAARALVLALVREAGGDRILKSKSMTTEEIELNPALEAVGYAPLETDLGEYIVQLAGEAPSHITAPALHRNAEEIRDLFREKGVLEGAGAVPEDRAELATWLSLRAREHLRDRLLDADIGITGANFLIARTGTVVLVENEGNIRYTTLSPRVQICVAGMEKILPRLEDLATFLPLLTRSATGQRATTYTSLITGPVGDALHVVLLDGGRSGMLASEEDREILRCIRCGACMNVCPVYRTIGGHPYGAPYPGPIGAVLMPGLRGGERDRELAFASTLCGACGDVCPVKIDLPGHLLKLRDRAVRRDARKGERRLWRGWAWAMARPGRYRLAARVARSLQGPLARLGLLASWTRHREAPRMGAAPFRKRWKRDA
jgi:L-lactate dehydrogenase complex protein LldF